jgi:hypothetical protein
MHNLVLETTRLSIEVKNLKMRVESLTGRLEFNERRARALEAVVVYKPSEEAPQRPGGEAPRHAPQPGGEVHPRPSPEGPAAAASVEVAPAPGPASAPAVEGPGQRSRRRRRRRGRRGGGAAAALMGAGGGSAGPPQALDAPRDTTTPFADHDEGGDDLEAAGGAIDDAGRSEPMEPASGAPASAGKREPAAPTSSSSDAGAATRTGPDDPQ